jgi:hypothetical protein
VVAHILVAVCFRGELRLWRLSPLFSTSTSRIFHIEVPANRRKFLINAGFAPTTTEAPTTAVENTVAKKVAVKKPAVEKAAGKVKTVVVK